MTSKVTPLQEGDSSPNFELPSNDGKKVKLTSFKGQKIILYFYPKDLTPGCTQQACDFTQQEKSFKKKNAVVIGISLDSVDRHHKFIQKYNLTHLLLSDEDHKVSEAYGVYQEKSLYGKKFMGIVRSTFVIDEKLKIKKIFSKVKVKDHWKEVLENLDC